MLFHTDNLYLPSLFQPPRLTRSSSFIPVQRWPSPCALHLIHSHLLCHYIISSISLTLSYYFSSSNKCTQFLLISKKKKHLQTKNNSNHIDNKSTSFDHMSILVLTCFPPSLERALCSHCLHFSLPTHFSTQWTLTHPTISLHLA